MNTYNMDFLIAALALLLAVLYHFMGQKKLDNASTRVFTCFMALGTLDVFFDLLTSVLLGHSCSSMVSILKMAMTAFYFFQMLIPYMIVYYANSLRNAEKEKIKKSMMYWAIIPVIIEIVVILNYWGGWIFSVDSLGGYHKGPFYMITYGYAFLYACAAAIISLVYRKEVKTKNIGIVWEFLLIEVVCVAIQIYTGKILTTGFGIGLGITVLYLSINNPSKYADSMTGVFNKRYFDEWIGEQLEKGKQIHLIAMDIYRLKQINKVFGTSGGDQILMQVGEGLQAINESAPIFRVTGNRFLMVMHSLSEYETSRDRVSELFNQTFEVKNETISLSAVICGIMHAEKMQETDTLIPYIEYMISLMTDMEGTVLIQSDDRTLEGFRYEQEVEHFLDAAIEQDLFEVYYQPVYSIEKKQYITLEALSRLRHPTLGFIPPDVFITIAEKSGKISQIGLLQFRKVCRFIRENEEIMETIKNVKFNLSPSELMRKGYGKMIVDIIKEYGLPYSYFQFEITETVATEHNENLYREVNEFIRLGMDLCLDDFGSGYANLNNVLRLPFTCVKIDRSLLEGICDDSHAELFYRNIVSIMKNMGYEVVSEGVETREEVEKLSRWGVDMIQGYYFSKPVNEKETVQILKSHV